MIARCDVGQCTLLTQLWFRAGAGAHGDTPFHSALHHLLVDADGLRELLEFHSILERAAHLQSE